MIRVCDLNFAYEQNRFHLHVAELSIAAGERVVWTGPSGAGKTTLLHLIAGIMLPATGRVKCCGVELSGLSAFARRNLRIARIGLVFQEFELLDYLNVLDNILLAYRINRSLRLDANVRHRARQLAAEVGLTEFLFRRPRQLSHGERQRVAVCRALVTNPMLVLADEPTANLDPDNASRVLDALDRHAEHHEATLVVVSHDKDVIPRFDRTIDISAFCGTPQTTGGGAHADER